MEVSADLIGSITSLYNGQRTSGAASFKTVTDFLKQFPENDRAKVYEIYTKCISTILLHSSTPPNSSNITVAPYNSLEAMTPPQTAVRTAVRAYNPNPYSSDFMAEYSVANNVVGSVNNVRVSLWARTKQRLVEIDSRALGYIGQGDARVGNNIGSPILRGEFLFCISYTFNGHHVERLDFFSDQGQPPLALVNGYAQFRDPIVPVRQMKKFVATFVAICQAPPAEQSTSRGRTASEDEDDGGSGVLRGVIGLVL